MKYFVIFGLSGQESIRILSTETMDWRWLSHQPRTKMGKKSSFAHNSLPLGPLEVLSWHQEQSSRYSASKKERNCVLEKNMG